MAQMDGRQRNEPAAIGAGCLRFRPSRERVSRRDGGAPIGSEMSRITADTEHLRARSQILKGALNSRLAALAVAQSAADSGRPGEPASHAKAPLVPLGLRRGAKIQFL